MILAVQAVHEKRIVHSDLKLGNFVIVQGELKIIDFGISKQIEGDTVNVYEESIMGTIDYMSPEMFTSTNGHFKHGRASDIWALGVILYRLCFGKSPFAGRTFPERMKNITDPNYIVDFKSQTVFGTEADPLLVDAISNCLRYNPDRRPTTQQLLLHPFLSPQFCDNCIRQMLEKFGKEST